MSAQEMIDPSAPRLGDGVFAWTDLVDRPGATIARSAALRYVLRSLGAPGRRVLVAGPHEPRLIASLVDNGAVVTWVLRSGLDADLLDARLAGSILQCGSIARLSP